eukprot:9498176-Pyramimonas_sp.AAC.1
MEGKKTGNMTKTDRGDVVSILVTVDLGQRQLVNRPHELAKADTDQRSASTKSCDILIMAP